MEIRSLKDLDGFARKFAKTLRGGETLALSGPLGAGKTTFTQLLGRALGVNERITSPTYTLMHLHPVSGRWSRGTVESSNGRRPTRPPDHPTTRPSLLVHIDAYRLNPRDLVAIGALDYLGAPGTVAVVEWGERVRRSLPKDAIWIDIIPSADGTARTVHLDRKPSVR